MANEDNLTELAKMFKNRDNQTPPSITTGIITSSPPNIKLKVGLIDDLDIEVLVIAAHLLEGEGLQQGDEVIVIPTNDDQTYYVVAKKAMTL